MALGGFWVGTVSDRGMPLAADGLVHGYRNSVTYYYCYFMTEMQHPERRVSVPRSDYPATVEVPLLETRLACSVHLMRSGKSCTCSRRPCSCWRWAFLR
jgi:hypothetical protein